MNNQTVLMSIGNDINTLVTVPIVLADEFDNVIYFSKNTLTSEVTAITLDNADYNEAVLNVVAPFTLYLNPSAFSNTSKIYKIDYDFGDGNIDSQTYFYSDESNSSLNHPNDIGDPRNYIKANTYFLDDNVAKNITITVAIHAIGSIIPSYYYLKLALTPPNLDGEIDGYFKNIHLISTKMFGPDDKILYTFESDEPNYILPAVVKWEEDPKIIQKRLIIFEPPRVFDILLPFEDEKNNSNTNKNIKYIEPNKPNTKIQDIGNLNVKSIKI